MNETKAEDKTSLFLTSESVARFGIVELERLCGSLEDLSLTAHIAADAMEADGGTYWCAATVRCIQRLIDDEAQNCYKTACILKEASNAWKGKALADESAKPKK